jgi:hypothetical protein
MKSKLNKLQGIRIHITFQIYKIALKNLLTFRFSISNAYLLYAKFNN